MNEHINSVLLISFADQGHQFVQLVSKEDLFPLLSDVVVRAIELVLGRLQVLVELLLFLSITAKQLLFARINVLPLRCMNESLQVFNRILKLTLAFCQHFLL